MVYRSFDPIAWPDWAKMAAAWQWLWESCHAYREWSSLEDRPDAGTKLGEWFELADSSPV